MQRAELESKIAQLPRGPGVYLFKDKDGKVLYVGKATCLRDRVRSYLRPHGDGRWLIPFLGKAMADLEVVLCDDPEQALILEDSLIKRFKPAYNVRLKDDKNYLLIRIDCHEEWPRLRLARRRKDDGALYFGPFASAVATRRTTSSLQKILQLRDCGDNEFRHRSRPCLKWDMGRCLAPCVGKVSPADYGVLVDRAVVILKGKGKDLATRMRQEMGTAAKDLAFERAQVIKERLEALERICGTGVVTLGTGESRDAFGFVRHGEEVDIAIVNFREGKLAGGERFHFCTGLPDEEVLSTAILRFYRGGRYVPGAVLVPFMPFDGDALAAWLSARRQGRVELHKPQRGDKLKLVEMARANVTEGVALRVGRQEAAVLALGRLGDLLGLECPPAIIHCFDVSHTQGAEMVASRTALRDGEPAKDLYRRFTVQGLADQDDFAALAQVVIRSLKRSQTAEDTPPDLVLVDGGAGQVSVVAKAMRRAGFDLVNLAGIAKARPAKRGRGGSRPRGPVPERLVLPGVAAAVELVPGEPETNMLVRVRDEAHRFAITYHRKRRGKTGSALDDIPGIGPARRKLLLRTFGSLKGLQAATREDIAAVPGIPATLAETVCRKLAKD